MKILITGASGFSARYLKELLGRDPDAELYLTDLVESGDRNILRCDLTQSGQVEGLIEEVRPARIFHLVGSFTNHYETDYSVNVLSTKNILDALLELDLKCRMLLIGSASEYGLVQSGDNPVAETCPLRPVRIHGLTKVYQTMLMDFYCRVYQMDLVMARVFNLYGDDRSISNRLFLGRVYEQIDKIKDGKLSGLKVGNLEARRDYIDVEDAVRCYVKIMDKGKAGEVYNVGSGSPVKMRDLLIRILRQEGLDESVVEEASPSVLDRTDIPEIFADMRKFNTL